MAWTIDTFAGLKANGPDSNWRVAGFELFRALNERQAALAATKTQFYKGSGALAADVSYADLEGIKTTDAGRAKSNMIALQAGIVALVNAGRFTVASGRSTLYSLASLEAAIGTSLHDAPEGPVDTRFWQAQKDALDLLIYGRSSATRSSDTTGLAEGENLLGSVSGSSSLAAAWAAALVDSPSTGLNWEGVWAFHASTAFSGSASANIVTPAEAYIPLGSFVGDFLGTLTDVDFLVFKSTPNNDYPTYFSVDDPMELIVGSGTASATSFTTTGATIVAEGAVGDITGFGSGGNALVTVECPTPSTCPVTFTGSGTRAFQARMEFKSAVYYHDIASELTDQA